MNEPLPNDAELDRRDLSSLKTMLKYGNYSQEDKEHLSEFIAYREKGPERDDPYAELGSRQGIDKVKFPHLAPKEKLMEMSSREISKYKNHVWNKLKKRERTELDAIVKAISDKEDARRRSEIRRRDREENERRTRKLREEMGVDAERWILKPDRPRKTTPKPERKPKDTSNIPSKKELSTMSRDAILTFAVDHFDELSPYEIGRLKYSFDEAKEREKRKNDAQASRERYINKERALKEKWEKTQKVQDLCMREIVAAKEKESGEKVYGGYIEPAIRKVGKVGFLAVGISGGIFGGICALGFLYFFFLLPLGSCTSYTFDHIANADKYEQERIQKQEERAAKEAEEKAQRDAEILADIEEYKQRKAEEYEQLGITTHEVGPGTEYYIKGNISADGERIYHMPGDMYYDETVIDTSRGERWFSSPEEAEAAGWRRAYV